MSIEFPMEMAMNLNRREMLHSAGAGAGMLGLAATLQSAGLLNRAASAASFPTAHSLQHLPRAKRVIF